MSAKCPSKLALAGSPMPADWIPRRRRVRRAGDPVLRHAVHRELDARLLVVGRDRGQRVEVLALGHGQRQPDGLTGARDYAARRRVGRRRLVGERADQGLGAGDAVQVAEAVARAGHQDALLPRDRLGDVEAQVVCPSSSPLDRRARSARRGSPTRRPACPVRLGGRGDLRARQELRRSSPGSGRYVAAGRRDSAVVGEVGVDVRPLRRPGQQSRSRTSCTVQVSRSGSSAGAARPAALAGCRSPAWRRRS